MVQPVEDPAGQRGPTLLAALAEVRAAVHDVRYPLAVPSAGPADEAVRSLVAQLDDYLLPRVRRIDAPLLAVVGGPTGGGKSTLVNSLVRSPVSPPGVLRPTTRSPVLVCHPIDMPWFAERELLPGLDRAPRPGKDTLQTIHAPLLAPGIALLDAPDFDSVVAANRALAYELLAAGDLWLFVTTAARYADAVPWRTLREARDRGTVVAVVLNRVPDGACDLISGHFARMLAAHDLGEAPLFTVCESVLDGYGLVREPDVAPIKRWLDEVARSERRRGQTTRRTLLGAVAALGPRLETLAQAAQDQVDMTTQLARAVRSVYADALSNVESSLGGGAIVRGEVYSRWNELLASGDLRLALGAARLRHRVVSDRPAPGIGLQAAVAAALADLVVEANVVAMQGVRHRWRSEPAGRGLLGADPTLGSPWAGFADAAHDLVHGWQRWLRALVRAEAPRARTRTRPFATASKVLLATIAAVAPPPEETIAAGTHAPLLRAVLANRAARELGEHARGEFLIRVGDLLSAEVDRHLVPVAAAGVDHGLAFRLRGAAAHVLETGSTADGRPRETVPDAAPRDAA